MRIALDLEEVLADTIREACNSTENLETTDFNDWNIDGYVWQVYSGVSDALWRHDPYSIPTVETGLHEATVELYGQVDQLDIVTARLHVDSQIEGWLEHNNIVYDNIVSTRRPKYELDYDIYIDDNPEMFGECSLLLRSHPHNEHLDTTDVPHADRIYSLMEAKEHIR